MQCCDAINKAVLLRATESFQGQIDPHDCIVKQHKKTKTREGGPQRTGTGLATVGFIVQKGIHTR